MHTALYLKQSQYDCVDKPKLLKSTETLKKGFLCKSQKSVVKAKVYHHVHKPEAHQTQSWS